MASRRVAVGASGGGNECRLHIAVGVERGTCPSYGNLRALTTAPLHDNRTQNAAIPGKHQIELVASFRGVTEWASWHEREGNAHTPKPPPDPCVRGGNGRRDPLAADAAGCCRARNPRRRASPD